MTTVKTKLTYDDYAAIDDGRRYELIDGELCMTPAPTPDHQRITKRLLRLLDDHVASRKLGEVLCAPLDVVPGPHDVVQPDILFVSTAHRERIGTRNLRGAPDLVIEILSPGTARRDRGAKTAIYHRAGVRELWIVDPKAETIEVFLPGPEGFKLEALYQGKELVRSSVLPDLELRAGQAFAD